MSIKNAIDRRNERKYAKQQKRRDAQALIVPSTIFNHDEKKLAGRMSVKVQKERQGG